MIVSTSSKPNELQQNTKMKHKISSSPFLKFSSKSNEPSNPEYPSISAPPAFTNAYEKLVEELDYVFNTDFQTFKTTHDVKFMS